MHRPSTPLSLLIAAASTLTALALPAVALASTGNASVAQVEQTASAKSRKVISFNSDSRVIRIKRADGTTFVGRIARGMRIAIDGQMQNPGALDRGDLVVKLQASTEGSVKNLRVASATPSRYRVNVGGPVLSASPKWLQDNPGRASAYLPQGAGRKTVLEATTAAIDMTSSTLPAGTPVGLFKNARVDLPGTPEMTWTFPVESGSDYEVRLYMAATSAVAQQAGGRVMDVDVNGASMLDDYDVFAEVGANKAVMKSIVTPAPAGMVTVTFKHVVDNPGVAGIEIVKSDSAPPPPPPPPPPPACSGVSIAPGTGLPAAVTASPSGTVFCLQAGTHVLNSALAPKTGQQFIGVTGTVLTGQDSTAYAFRGGGTDVVIKGLIIERFNNPLQTGAVDSAGAWGWVIDGNEVRNNNGIGVCIDTNGKMINNFIHHQGQMGICAHGADGLIENNEVSFNNTEGNDWYWEAGGSKFVNSTRLTLRGNYVHDNIGPGLWADYQNVGTIYENNRIENNAGPGIFHEISYGAIIRNNVVKNNAHLVSGDKTIWWGGAGILIANSPDVEVYGNTLENNNGAIGIINIDRGSGNLGLFESRNTYVHDNVITMRTGRTGLVTNDNAYFTSKGIRFERNQYFLDSLTSGRWEWSNATKNKEEWKGYGLDMAGTYQLAP